MFIALDMDFNAVELVFICRNKDQNRVCSCADLAEPWGEKKLCFKILWTWKWKTQLINSCVAF